MSQADFVSAQSLRWMIRISRKQVTRDGMGGEVVSYVKRCEPRADIRQITGREQLRNDQRTSTHAIEVRMRYREDIELTDVIIWKGQVYDIQDISPIGMNRSLRILATQPAPRTT